MASQGRLLNLALLINLLLCVAICLCLFTKPEVAFQDFFEDKSNMAVAKQIVLHATSQGLTCLTGLLWFDYPHKYLLNAALACYHLFCLLDASVHVVYSGFKLSPIVLNSTMLFLHVATLIACSDHGPGGKTKAT